VDRNITPVCCNIPVFFFSLAPSIQAAIANKIAKLGKISEKLYNLP
jgi:hypothetical protein